MSAYLLKRGKGWQRRKVHLAKFDAFGRVASSWCGRSDYDLTSNVPWWGRSRCKDCLRMVETAIR